MTQIWPNLGEPYLFTVKQIKTIEQAMKATWIADCAIPTPTGDGERTDRPLSIFWVEHPDTTRGHKHIIGIYREDGATMICDATAIQGMTVPALIADNGERCCTCYPHHYNTPESGTGYIDGSYGHIFRATGKVELYTIDVPTLLHTLQQHPGHQRYSRTRFRPPHITP